MTIYHTQKFRIHGDEPEAERVLKEMKEAWKGIGYACKLRQGYPSGVSWLLECEQEIPWGEGLDIPTNTLKG